MTVTDKTRIRSAASEMLRTVWRTRNQIWSNPPTRETVIPIPVNRIAQSLLGVIVEEPEEIPSDREGFETAGFMDRATNRIVVAQKFKQEYRRFTMAHEIAHWVIHPDVAYHRDRPLSGGEQANASRPKEEQEADVFASELLMPSKQLIKYFQTCFGGPIDGRFPNSKLAIWLSTGSPGKVDQIQLFEQLRYRALIISQAAFFGSHNYFIPLAKLFGVSSVAMAIQLEDLGLVI